MKLLAATNNSGKIKELNELLADLPIEFFGLERFKNIVEPKETGEVFMENACLKASSYALQTGFWSLSDDSGLEVEALGGAPGIFSARYAGKDATDAERAAKLLQELGATGDENRRARFFCAMAIADETGKIRFSAEGICDGKIALESRGANGFGYDPVFIPEGFDQTFGELSAAIKREISHRARAISKIIRFLGDFTTLELDQRLFRL